jgi:hypothetical protein
MPVTPDDYAREHAITLYNELHGVSFARTPDFAKPHRDSEIEIIIKAFRSFALSNYEAGYKCGLKAAWSDRA